MKHTFIILLILFCFSCSDDSSTSSGMFSWVLSEQTFLDNSRQFFSSENTELQIELSSTSLCPANGVAIAIETDGFPSYNKTVSTFPFEETIQIENNSVIDVSTAIVTLPDSTINCVHLGEVLCEFSY